MIIVSFKTSFLLYIVHKVHFLLCFGHNSKVFQVQVGKLILDFNGRLISYIF